MQAAVDVSPISRHAQSVAKRELNLGLELEPNSALGLFIRGEMELASGNSWDGAVRDFQELRHRNLNFPAVSDELHFLLGAALVGTGDLAHAREAYQTAADLASDPQQEAYATELLSLVDRFSAVTNVTSGNATETLRTRR